MYRMNAQSRAIEEAFLRYGIRYQLVGGDAVLQPARGQGRAGVPPGPALRHRRGQLRADHQRPGPGDRRQDDRGPARWPQRQRRRSRPGRRSSGPAGARSRGSQPRTRAALAEFAALIARLRTRVGVLPLPELLDEVLEASGYRAMLADGSEDGEERWANLLELRSVTTRYDDLAPDDALDRLLEETALVADQDSYEGDADARDADHAPRREGPRVPGRVHRRPRGGPVPAQPGARRREGARGGAAARLRRDDPGEAAAVPVARLAAGDLGDGPGSVPSRFLLEIPAELMVGPAERASRRRVDDAGLDLDLDLAFGARRTTRFGTPVRPARGAGVPPGERPARRADGRRGVPAGPRPRREARGVRGRRARSGGARPGRRPTPAPAAAAARHRAGLARSSPASASYRDGDRVRHARWGDGIVVSRS